VSSGRPSRVGAGRTFTAEGTEVDDAMPDLVLALLELLELIYLGVEGVYERVTRSGDDDGGDDPAENRSGSE